ncbi:MAG: phosphoglucosamine mutase [Deltaproteobacteria bacterium]|nr:phosphoglucosamine mutase [Deltaproteobacteria bacterium]MBW2413828.1 phosphoglucosamine mutase [Deltaproteobacteria bacterium]
MSATRKLFGTDGIRGEANVYPMTGEVIFEVGRALAMVFRLGHERARQRVLIAKDTRLSGYMLEDALASGLCSMGVDVLQVGPIPTPGLAFLTVDMRCAAGAMISASHNPFADNGIKLFSRDGFKLPDEVEARIESLMHSDELNAHRPVGSEIGAARRIDDATGRYVVFLKNTFPKELTLEGLRIVVDCANGAAYKVAPTVLEELGAEVIAIHAAPNGTNINDGCGALYPERISGAVLSAGADLGIALDGDADRVVLCDERGEIVDGDAVLGICALDMHERGVLSRDTVVATVMSNLGLEVALERAGVKLLRAQVGDRYVVELMRREQLNLGGEQSGHIVFLDHIATGDGLLTSLQVLATLLRRRCRLSELTCGFERFPQVLHSIPVSEQPPLEEIEPLQDMIGRVEGELAGKGRVLVRYSGTERLARVMVEGEDAERIERAAEEICGVLRAEIGGDA